MADRTSTIAQYDIDESGILAATWVLSATLGIAFMQLMTYLPTRHKESLLLQGTVIFLFMNETVSTILSCVGTHKQLLVSKPGTLESLSLPKTFIIACFHANITLLGVNIFMVYRYYRLTRRWWLSIPLGVLAFAAMVVRFVSNGYGLAAASYVLQPSIDLTTIFGAVDNVMLTSKIASTLEFVVVAGTYSCLVIELTKFMRQDLLNGKKVLRRLLMATIESGVVTFGLAIALIALSWSAPFPSTINTVMSCCARAYYHTLLFNLNMRTHGGMMMQEADPTLTTIASSMGTRDTGSTGAPLHVGMPLSKSEKRDQHDLDTQAKKEDVGTHGSSRSQSLESV